jgi:hypothetical protein
MDEMRIVKRGVLVSNCDILLLGCDLAVTFLFYP